jgi:hypothetical protein
MFEISRRDLVLSATCAYAAFGLTKPIATRSAISR